MKIAPKAPLRRVVGRPSQLREELECGHVIKRPLGLGEDAQKPSTVKRRRCHLCAELPQQLPKQRD